MSESVPGDASRTTTDAHPSDPHAGATPTTSARPATPDAAPAPSAAPEEEPAVPSAPAEDTPAESALSPADARPASPTEDTPHGPPADVLPVPPDGGSTAADAASPWARPVDGTPETPTVVPAVAAGQPFAPGEIRIGLDAPGYVPPPPPPRPRRTGMWVGGGVAAVVVLALIVGLIGVPLYQKLFAPPPTERVLAAASALAAADAVHLSGGLSVDDNGTQQQVDLTVDVHGAAYGTLRRAGGRADVVADDDGNTYVKGDERWMLATDPQRAGYQAGHWVSAGSGLSILPSKVTPTELAAYLKTGLRANDPRHAAVDAGLAYPRTVRGTAVTPYRLPGGAVAYVSADEPYRLVGLDGTVGTADTAHLSLDVTSVSKAAFDKAMSGRPADGADDLAEPARYDASKADSGSCDPSSCTEYSTVKADGGDTSRGGHLIGVFSSDNEGRHVIGSCTTKLPRIQPNHSAKVACTTTSDRWQNWAASTSSGHFWVLMVPLSAGYDDDPGLVLDLLTSGRLRGMSYVDVGGAASSLAGLDVLNRLAQQHGWTGDTAMEAASTFAENGALGVVRPLLDGDHLVLDGDTFAARFEPSDLPLYDEAARRVAGGAGRIAVGRWTDGDGTAYEGDMFDLAGKRAVTVTDLTAASRAAVRATVTKDARAARAADVPKGFGRELRIVANPRSPLYRLRAADVRDALRDAGVRRKDVAGLAAIVVSTRAGTVTLHPADFA